MDNKQHLIILEIFFAPKVIETLRALEFYSYPHANEIRIMCGYRKPSKVDPKVL